MQRRTEHALPGVHIGAKFDKAAGRSHLLVRDGREETLPGKVQLQLHAGDRLRIETPGGGGYGTPDKKK